MRTYIIFSLLILLNYSCETKHESLTQRSSLIEQGFSVIDSLNKYEKADSLFNFPDHFLYSGVINNKSIGLSQWSDTSFIIYQKTNNQWHQTDTIPNSLVYVFEPQDLNGDTYKDLIITYAIHGAGGNGSNISLLFNPKTNLFYHNKYFDLPNIRYESSRNMVVSSWWGGVKSCQQKMCYNILGDSLVFCYGVFICPSKLNELGRCNLEYYKRNRNDRIVNKSLTGLAEKLYPIFDTSIWNSSNE